MFPCLHTTAKKRFAQMAIRMHQRNEHGKTTLKKQSDNNLTVSEVFFVTSDGAVKRYQSETRRVIATHKR